MTDKQIIIDGVDVSGCKYFANNKCLMLCATGTACDVYPYCYYKAYKAKEQECERVKERLESFQKDYSKLYQVVENKGYIKELDQLKEEKAVIENLAKTHLAETFEMQREIDQLKAENEILKQYRASKQASYESMQREWNDAVNENRELKQTLTEIKEIAETQRRYIDDIKGFMFDDKIVEWKSAYIDFSTACRRLNQEILQKISECEGNNETN